MKLSFILATLILFPQWMWGYSRVGNGGAGFYQDGQYMTFFSGKLKVRSTPLEMDQLPGLSLLINRINKAPLSAQNKANLLSLIYPVGNMRTYYKIAEEDLSPELRKEILDQYSKLTGEPVKNLVLFAMTNDIQQTFLLPEFFQLKEIEQAVMLLHESLWNLHVQISYKQMVELEMAAQDSFTYPDDPGRAFTFLNSLQQVLRLKKPAPEVLLQGAFYYTYMVHPPGNPGVEVVPVSAIFDLNFLQCYQGQSLTPLTLGRCSSLLQTNLMTKNGAHLTWFEMALLGILNDNTFDGFLCFREADHQGEFKSKYYSNILDWWNDASFEAPAEFWQEDEALPPAFGNYTVVSKMFKVYEGNHYWGDFGVCYNPNKSQK